MISTSCQAISIPEPNYAHDCARIVVWADSTPLASADIAADRGTVTLQFAVTPGHLPDVRTRAAGATCLIDART